MKMLNRFLTLFVFLAFASPAFAAIPMEQAVSEAQQPIVKQEKKVQKRSKLKNRLLKKVKATADIGEDRTAAIVFAILLPFVGVAIYQDGITSDFWITLGLWLLGILPGIIYALTIVLKRY